MNSHLNGNVFFMYAHCVHVCACVRTGLDRLIPLLAWPIVSSVPAVHSSSSQKHCPIDLELSLPITTILSPHLTFDISSNGCESPLIADRVICKNSLLEQICNGFWTLWGKLIGFLSCARNTRHGCAAQKSFGRALLQILHFPHVNLIYLGLCRCVVVLAAKYSISLISSLHFACKTLQDNPFWSFQVKM